MILRADSFFWPFQRQLLTSFFSFHMLEQVVEVVDPLCDLFPTPAWGCWLVFMFFAVRFLNIFSQPAAPRISLCGSTTEVDSAGVDDNGNAAKACKAVGPSLADHVDIGEVLAGCDILKERSVVV